MACVRASIPVAAVRPGGMPTMSSGSSTATSGVTCQSTIAILTCLSSSVTMQNLVISLAVPAVVFTATIGSIFFALLFSPS